MSYDYFSKSMMQYILDKIKPFIDAKVPSTRKVNNKALSSDISISASDVGAPALDGNNKVPIANTPSNYVEVANDTARFALTTATVHNGMNVGVTATDKLYLIIDDTHLNSETGYKDIGSMSSVDWDDIQNKPDNLAYIEGASGQSVEPISPFLHASDIANNLTTTTPGKVLDATQGKALQDELDNAAYLGTPIVGSVDPISPVLYQADVVNDLVTNDSTKPLSAAMGKQLNSTLTQYADIDTPILSTDTSTYKDFVTNIPNGCIIISATFIYNDDFFYYCNSVGIPAVTIKDDGNKLTIKSSKSIALKDTTNRALKVRIAYKNIS